jgi:hypothetical protein
LRARSQIVSPFPDNLKTSVISTVFKKGDNQTIFTSVFVKRVINEGKNCIDEAETTKMYNSLFC